MTIYSWLFLVIFVGVLATCFSLFNEEHVITTKSKKPPFLTRILKHVYYIGTIDNGTLSCKMTGAVSYSWKTISKEEVHDVGFVYSWENKHNPPNPDRPWEFEIHHKNYLTESLLVQCQGISGYEEKPIAEIIWVVTRLHSPLGYPTDPMVCGQRRNECWRLSRRFRVECQADVTGKAYRGSQSTTSAVDGKKCQDWCMYFYDSISDFFDNYMGKKAADQYEGMETKFLHNLFWGEHNFCRSHRRRPFSKPECITTTEAVKPMSYVISGAIDKDLSSPCVIPQCSDCKYHKGTGSFPGVSFEVPKYSGPGIDTMQSYTVRKRFNRPTSSANGKQDSYIEKDVAIYRQCYRNHKAEDSANAAFWFFDNICRNILRIKGLTYRADEPSCLVQKGKSQHEIKVRAYASEIRSKLKLAPCRIRQCTVRLVWFMFFDQDGHLIVDTIRSTRPRKFSAVVGQRYKIPYFAFGIHKLNGMVVVPGPNNIKSGPKNIKQWRNTVKRVPGMSILDLGKMKKEFSGDYTFEYEFDEAKTKIGETATYRQNFEIEVLEPMRVELSPAQLDICEWEEGTVHLKIYGDFEPEDIKWSYSLHENKPPFPVGFDTVFVKIDGSARKATVGQTTWLFVSVHWAHGILKAKAKVSSVGRPLLQNVSPLLTITKPGTSVKLAVATNNLGSNLKWIHDAQRIAEIPDDPDMSFSKIKTPKEIIHVLSIENMQEQHYGGYTVKATNNLKCENTLEFIVNRPPERKTSKRIRSSQVPLTNETFAQFKAIMDFMNQDCGDIIQPYSRNAKASAERLKKERVEEEIEEEDIEEEEIEEEEIKQEEIKEVEGEEVKGEEEQLKEKEEGGWDEMDENIWSEAEEESEEEGDLKRKKTNVPVEIEDVLSKKKSICIYPQRPKPYFEINLGNVFRIKGIRIFQKSFDSDVQFRLMYSLNGCKWKIYGIKSYNPKNISNINSQVENKTLITRLEMKYETKTFSDEGNITWVGNTSLLLARHIRLVPAAVDTRYKMCIRITLHGCSAPMFHDPEESETSYESGNVSIGSVITSVLGSILGCILLVIAVLLVLRKWKLIQIQARRKNKRRSLVSAYDTRRDNSSNSDNTDSSDSKSSKEHFYWEIAD